MKTLLAQIAQFAADDQAGAAVEYAIEKCKKHRGEIRLVNAEGEIEKTIPFDDSSIKKAKAT